MKCRLPWMLFCLATASPAAQPLSPEEVNAAAARIDTAVADVRRREEELHQQRNRTAPSALAPQCGDDVFLRRVCVDLAGRLPKADEVRAFLADPGEDKRARLIDRLVAESGAAEVRFFQIAEALRVKDRVGRKSQEPFIAWLREGAAKDMPYNELMAAMLRAEGDVDDNPAAGMLRRDGGNMLRTSMELADAFLGAQLYCTHCHDHPYSNYTQRQSYEFANCFYLSAVPAAAKVNQKPNTLLPGAVPVGRRSRDSSISPAKGVPLPLHYKYRNGKPGEVVAPRYLPLDEGSPSNSASSFLGAPPARAAHLREGLVQWFTGPQNARFAQVGALRQWQHLFGAFGYVSCFRDMDDAGEAYHDSGEMVGCDMPPTWSGLAWQGDVFDRDYIGAAVLAALGVEFKRCGYRTREFQRILARTQAYQRQAGPRDPLRAGPLNAPMVRRLPADVIWKAWTGWLPGDQQVAVPQVPDDKHPLRLLGRGKREWSDESRTVISHQFTAFMMADPLLKNVAVSPKLAPAGGRAATRVENLFLDILGRFPLDAERTAALRHLSAHPKTGVVDLAWALLNTSEFLFQH
ncbi:MAG TPA: DUF1549 domain-containing protein [Prosthecobacter sp.]|nr:DUF1549 domain-containing protein [Prosthecobacter sp.]